MSIRILFLSILTFLLSLTGCQSPPPPDTMFEPTTAALPGTRLYLAGTLPTEYEAALNQVYQVHQEKDDVWLFASDDVLAQMDASGDFRAWLRATRPLLFHSEAGPVSFIPAHPEMDRLSFVLDHHLEKWADEEQLAHLWLVRGDALRTQGAFAAAAEAYEQALALDPDLVAALGGLGAALLGQGESEQALKALLLATTLDPQDYWAQRLLGNAYLNLQRYEMAAAPLTKAYFLKPQDAHLLLGVALALGRSGQPHQALRVLDEAAFRITDPKLLDDIQALRIEFCEGGD